MNKFRPPAGIRYTRGLFYETTLADKTTVLYTLKEQDHEVDGVIYPSLRRLYLEANDPTEYSFAITHLDGIDHWNELLACKWFKPYIEKWRRELELKIKSEALLRLRDMAAKGGRESFQINKFLVEKGWEPKDGQTKRGRPTKDEVNQEAQRIAEERSRIEKDAERLLQ